MCRRADTAADLDDGRQGLVVQVVAWARVGVDVFGPCPAAVQHQQAPSSLGCRRGDLLALVRLPGRVRGCRELCVVELAGLEPASLAERPDRRGKFRTWMEIRARRFDQVVPAAFPIFVRTWECLPLLRQGNVGCGALIAPAQVCRAPLPQLVAFPATRPG